MDIISPFPQEPGLARRSSRGRHTFGANLLQLHARPSSPFYSEMSEVIARVFNQTLKGELTGNQAAETLQNELSAIVVRNR